MSLTDSIQKLRVVCSRFSILAQFSSSSWSNGLWPNNCVDLVEFYRDFNPLNFKFDTCFGKIKIHAAEELVAAQVGYRQIYSGTVLRANATWADNQWVIGDDVAGGRPIIAEVVDGQCRVLGGYSSVRPFCIARSLPGFLSAVASLIELVYGEYDVFGVVDDDDEIKAGFLEKLKAIVIEDVGEEYLDGFVDYFYG